MLQVPLTKLYISLRSRDYSTVQGTFSLLRQQELKIPI